MPARANTGTSSQTAPIMARFRSTGVAAGTGEPAPGVEDAGRERDQRDEADVREHHPGHDDGVVEALEARGHQPDDDRRGDDADDAGDDQRREQHGGDGVDQLPGRVVAVGGAGARQRRHERLGEGALAEQAAQQVGDAKGDVERVERGAGAEHRRDDDVAHQAGDPRRQREERNRRRRAEQVHGKGGVGQRSWRARRCYTRGLCRKPSSVTWPPPPKPRRRPSASPPG
jgi:hypothetical protein